MPIAFFVSSIGDTDLAKETIVKLAAAKVDLFIIPLTTTAVDRTKDLANANLASVITIADITKQDNALTSNKISQEELEKIAEFIKSKNIKRICVGVPSVNNEVPFQIANYLDVSCHVAYEYMFRPSKHIFWNYVSQLAGKDNCDFSVPLRPASEDILKINSKAKVSEIGHLSIDRSQVASSHDASSTRKALDVGNKKELIFISGTTQPTEIDNQFLDALLRELTEGKEKYTNLEIRMGIHPGILGKDPVSYLNTLFRTCELYPQISNQFKIIIDPKLTKRMQELKHPLSPSNPFIQFSDTPGAAAALAADKVAQAVPGALLNEAALKGKPSYFHETSAIPYLPRNWFANNIATFFSAKTSQAHSLQELGLDTDAPSKLAKVIMAK